MNGTVAGKRTKEYEQLSKSFQIDGNSIFANMQWKRSINPMHDALPFPDLRVRIVKEIVSSGGKISLKDGNPNNGGKHLKPMEFHRVLQEATPNDNLVILDVRNRWEHAVGHFTDAAGRKAISLAIFRIVPAKRDLFFQ